MTFAKRLPLMLFAIGIPAAAAAGEPLGRLFFTPEQRAQFDNGRQADEAVAADTLAVDGIVSRPGGKATVWINGRPYRENAAENSMRAIVSAQRPDLAAIVADRTARFGLRVGEAFDRRTGRRHDLIDAGTVQVHTDNGLAQR